MPLKSSDRLINPAQFQPGGPGNGVFEFAAKSIPVGTTFVIGLIKRQAAVNGIEDYPLGQLVVDYYIKISRDAGVTWHDLVDLQAEGGVRLLRDGSPRIWDRHKIVNQYLNSDNPSDANTRIKAIIKVHSQVSTETWVEYYDDITQELVGGQIQASQAFLQAQSDKSKF